MKRIGIDLDQVLADFTSAFDEFHDTSYGTDFRNNPPTEFYLRNSIDVSEEEELRRVKEFYSTDYFLKMRPLPKSVEAIKILAQDNELYLITSRPEFVKKETCDWINKYFPSCFKDIILTNHYFGGTKKKSAVCLEKQIDYMVEDMAHYANDCAEAGISTFLITKNWNKSEKLAKNVTRVDDWAEIIKIILNR